MYTVPAPSIRVEDMIPSEDGNCIACGHPSEYDFCFRPECMTYGSAR